MTGITLVDNQLAFALYAFCFRVIISSPTEPWKELTDHGL